CCNLFCPCPDRPTPRDRRRSWSRAEQPPTTANQAEVYDILVDSKLDKQVELIVQRFIDNSAYRDRPLSRASQGVQALSSGGQRRSNPAEVWYDFDSASLSVGLLSAFNFGAPGQEPSSKSHHQLKIIKNHQSFHIIRGLKITSSEFKITSIRVQNHIIKLKIHILRAQNQPQNHIIRVQNHAIHAAISCFPASDRQFKDSVDTTNDPIDGIRISSYIRAQ
uniref:TGFb_propeptide domain-containing protein n=1 Tax=Macrostomum lignano TaxID=282301 RepID=A0A1I8F7N2_9PLAT